jgi:hypothetical protein
MGRLTTEQAKFELFKSLLLHIHSEIEYDELHSLALSLANGNSKEYKKYKNKHEKL